MFEQSPIHRQISFNRLRVVCLGADDSGISSCQSVAHAPSYNCFFSRPVNMPTDSIFQPLHRGYAMSTVLCPVGSLDGGNVVRCCVIGGLSSAF